ncbi:hypothetical protein PUN28_004456 [Cardiocondyla obscurior]|uniref:Uncharacterized protein n=1 Tax=Cardiocondyla obscurior TaxID=286306 RepID=A0AAW2GDR8_9HYME
MQKRPEKARPVNYLTARDKPFVVSSREIVEFFRVLERAIERREKKKKIKNKEFLARVRHRAVATSGGGEERKRKRERQKNRERMGSELSHSILPAAIRSWSKRAGGVRTDASSVR